MFRAIDLLVAACSLTAVCAAAPLAPSEIPSPQQFVESVERSPAVAIDAAGAVAEALRVERPWRGGSCRATLVNEGSRPVRVREVRLCSWEHGLDPDVGLYGEGLQMLSQTGGTLGAPRDLGYLTDRGHYKLPVPPGADAVVYSMMMLSGESGRRLLLGFTSGERFVARFELYPGRIDVVVDTEGLELGPGERWELDELLALSGDHRDDLLAELGARLAANHPRLASATPPGGWCSWYCFGPAVTAEDVRRNLSWIAERGPDLRYIQIDDGYQPAMGDWLGSGKSFGGGVQNVLREIREAGFEPAIWVAPFIAEKDSTVFREHPDWFMKGPDVEPLRSDTVSFGGWRRGPWYCLDGTHPEVQAHFRELFRTMREEWGCSYFKLDATFWGMMHGGTLHDPKATRVEAYRRGMRAILEGTKDAFVLGCNHPIWPSLGLIHGSRSSMDVARRWETIWRTGRENLYRNWQNGVLWWNDPDCLLLTSNLSDSETLFHASLLHATGGMLLSGDDLPKLGAEGVARLEKLARPTGVPCRFADETLSVGTMELEGETRIFLFNESDEPRALTFEVPRRSALLDFWTAEALGFREGPVTLDPLPPHSARVIRCLHQAEGVAAGTRQVPLTSLDLSLLQQGWGEPQVDRNIVGNPLRIGERAFARGLGSHAASVFRIALGGGTERFTAWVGVDDEAQQRGSIVFEVRADGEKVFDSGLLRGTDGAREVDVDLSGVQSLVLITRGGGDGIDYDHANWAEATFHVSGPSPRAIAAPREEKVILTPPPGPEPRVHCPRVQGVRPGRPFMLRIPCTGTRPIEFSADGLPLSLYLEPDTGILRGKAPETPGSWTIALEARNEHGASSSSFELRVGEELALCPPMGWNSWYIHYDRVTEADLRAAADAMIASGMADFGYQYVNIDDCWMKKKGDEPYRGDNGALLCNAKFPDIAGMCDYIHARGLRAGTYTSPGPWTCAGYVGAWEHELEDARQIAEWGFDFLKYDWCSYGGVATGEDPERLKIPYRKISAILRGQGRDLVLNLCQYGMGDVWTWGGDVGGHCWRTTGDLGLARGDLLPGFYRIGLANARHWEHAGPGRWNDPDYLLIGWVGSAHRMGEGEPTALTGNEQYSYMSMWSLMAAPLIFSGDMTKLDPFTLNVLCNAEVIEVDQDPLGKQARIVLETEDRLVLAKPMEDGSIAVGLFNLGELPATLTLPLEALGLEGPVRARDLWRQREVGVLEDGAEVAIPRHGVALWRLRPVQ